MSKLIYAEFSRGFLGNLKMLGRDWAEEASAFVAAHDIIDHTPKDRGTIENEMRALACGLLTRRRIEGYSPERMAHNLSSDVAAIMRDHFNKQPRHKRAPEVHLIDPKDKEMVDEIFRLARKWMEADVRARPFARHLVFAKRWFTFGLVLAYQRYGHIEDLIGYKFRHLRDDLGAKAMSMDSDNRLGVLFDPATGDYAFEEIETPEYRAKMERMKQLERRPSLWVKELWYGGSFPVMKNPAAMVQFSV